jgi:hypothetical protein
MMSVANGGSHQVYLEGTTTVRCSCEVTGDLKHTDRIHVSTDDLCSLCADILGAAPSLSMTGVPKPPRSLVLKPLAPALLTSLGKDLLHSVRLVVCSLHRALLVCRICSLCENGGKWGKNFRTRSQPDPPEQTCTGSLVATPLLPNLTHHSNPNKVVPACLNILYHICR